MKEIKRFIKHHKKEVTIIGIVLLILVFGIVLYKSLFYSSSEKSVYGIRTRDIKEHKIGNKQIDKWKDEVMSVSGVNECKITIKGRLIKYFVGFDDNVSTDDIKTKFNDIVKNMDENIKSYYDIELYAKQSKDSEMKYPVIGYKHKKNDSVSYDTF